MMFGLSKQEILYNAVKNACDNEVGVMRDYAKNFTFTDQSTREEAEQQIIEMQRAYFNAVFDAVWASFRISSPKIEQKMRYIMTNAAITGIDPDTCNIDVLNKYGISGALTYAIAYYALTDKKITKKEYKYMLQLEQYQVEKMTGIFMEFDVHLP